MITTQLHHTHSLLSPIRFANRTATDLNNFINFVVTAVGEVSYDGEIEGWEYAWTLPNALLFTISIMTVVG